jgi:hypothetical protein
MTLLSFQSYLTEASAAKDRHLTHIEDAVLEGGVAGTRNAIEFLVSLRNMFADDGKKINEARGQGTPILRTKFDGAPALYAGINPENGKFFVGSKSIFAQNAKLNYTVADIRANHQGGLADKLITALTYLPELGITDIVHGDFMFSQNELKKSRIDGKEYITFQPNTITYAVPVDSAIARQIQQAKMGIVFHTTYYGDTMQTLKTHFDVNISKFRHSKNVWFRENRFTDVTGKATLTPAENARLSSILSSAGALFRKIPASLLNEIAANEAYRIPIMTFHNQKVREGAHIGPKHTQELVNYIQDKHNANVLAAKKTETKQKRVAEKNKIVGWFRRNAQYLKMIFDLQNLLIDAKMLLINKLNQVSDIGTFMATSDGGFRVTAPEGYVAAWSTGDDAVKLVDRLNFSKDNFLATKTWSKK